MCYLLFELKLIERAIFVNLTKKDYVGTKRKQQIDKYIRMILVSRGGMCLASVRGGIKF